MYVLDTGEQDDDGSPLHLPKNSAGYTDVVSGNKMTAEEFDQVLGLAGVLGVRSANAVPLSAPLVHVTASLLIAAAAATSTAGRFIRTSLMLTHEGVVCSQAVYSQGP